MGSHAQVINKIIALHGSSVPRLDREFAKAKTGIQNINNSELEISKLFPLNENSATCTSTVTAKELDISSPETSLTDPLEMAVLNCETLSESVGHTRVQVLVGALLGFAISLIIDATL